MPEFDNSISGFVNQVLDANFKKVTKSMFEHIFAITNNPESAMQQALTKLDEEVERLNEAEQRMEPDNAVLEQTMRAYEETLNATQALILANDEEVELSGAAVAPGAVTAKVFIAASTAIAVAGGNPVVSTPAISATLVEAGIQWNIPSAVDIAARFVASEEWIAKMAGWGTGFAELAGNTIVTGISNGVGPNQTASQVRLFSENIPLSAAENVTRTLQLTSYREAELAMEVANSEFIEGKIRIASLDQRTCLACFSGDTIVSGPAPQKVFSRYYAGSIVVIKTTSGKNITVTPNHPILTDNGWVRAGELRKGSNVIRCSGEKGAFDGVNVDDYQSPTAIEQISESFGVPLAEMKCTPPDFHGDGKGSDVYTVRTNGPLHNHRQALAFQHIREDNLRLTNKGQASLSRALLSLNGSLAAFFQRCYSWATVIAKNIISLAEWNLGGAQSNSFGHTSPLRASKSERSHYGWPRNPIGFSKSIFSFARQVSLRDFLVRKIHAFVKSQSASFVRVCALLGFASKQSPFLQDNGKPLSTDAESGRKLLDSLAGHISKDCILDVDIRSFRGHVYNLETKTGWYIANGIIAHNCIDLHGTPLAVGERVDDHYRGRCSSYFVTVGGPRLPSIMQSDSLPGDRNFVPFQNGNDWFDSLPSQRQAQQASFLNTPAKFRAFKDGVPLSDFVGDHEDPVFGHQFVEDSLVGAIGDDADQYYNINQE